MSERLRFKLGIPPSTATRALVEDGRRGRVARPAAELLRGAPMEAWAEAASGAPRNALVTGEPGIPR